MARSPHPASGCQVNSYWPFQSRYLEFAWGRETLPPVAKQTHTSAAGGFLLSPSLVSSRCITIRGEFYDWRRPIVSPWSVFSPRFAAGGFRCLHSKPIAYDAPGIAPTGRGDSRVVRFLLQQRLATITHVMAYLIGYFLVSLIVFGYLGFWVAVECGRGGIEGFVLAHSLVRWVLSLSDCCLSFRTKRPFAKHVKGHPGKSRLT